METQDQQAIAEALGFSANDLAVNRAGLLSDRQRGRMGNSRDWGSTSLAVTGLVTAAFIVVIAVAVMPPLSAGKGSGSSPAVPAVAGTLAVIAIVMALSTLRTRRSLHRLAADQVSRTEGIAATRVRHPGGNVADPLGMAAGHGDGVRFELTIGGVCFFVRSKAVLTAFQDGHVYCGYYVGKGYMAALLSAEPSPAGSAAC